MPAPARVPSLSGTLIPRAPFDFALSLRFIENFNTLPASQAITRVDGWASLSKAFSLSGRAVLARVWATGTVAAPSLTYTLTAAEPLDEVLAATALDRLRFYLSLDDDLEPFYAAVQPDVVFAPVLKALYGYHQVKFATPFENACWAVLSQRNGWTLTRRMHTALAEAFGPHVTAGGQTFTAFPEPELLAVVGPEALAETIHHKPKGACLSGVAHAFAGVDEIFLRTAPYPLVESWLRGIRCLGPWSAGFILLRGLGRMDGLPAGEARIVQAAAKRYGADVVDSMAAKYTPHQGYWAHYLRVMGDD
jgi:DNA-3-methyladenine glycosylase II